jgi:hypothetical protein
MIGKWLPGHAISAGVNRVVFLSASGECFWFSKIMFFAKDQMFDVELVKKILWHFVLFIGKPETNIIA